MKNIVKILERSLWSEDDIMCIVLTDDNFEVETSVSIEEIELQKELQILSQEFGQIKITHLTSLIEKYAQRMAWEEEKRAAENAAGESI